MWMLSVTKCRIKIERCERLVDELDDKSHRVEQNDEFFDLSFILNVRQNPLRGHDQTNCFPDEVVGDDVRSGVDHTSTCSY